MVEAYPGLLTVSQSNLPGNPVYPSQECGKLALEMS